MTSTALIRPAWTPATIALMVLGFVVFWPLGLAMLAYIIWGDRLEEFKTEMNKSTDSMMSRCRGARRRNHARSSYSGNVAFDEWREAELNRLHEERRKLDEMREEFDTHMRDLRRAKHQEEFDRFMASRKASDQTRDAGPSVPGIHQNDD